MATCLHSLKKLTLLIYFFLFTGIVSAQTDFLFVVDNSGSISPSEFDAFAGIIMETGAALDANCTPTEYAIVHYGGAFGQEYTIQNDFVEWDNTSMVSRVYVDCNTSGSSDCGDDLFSVFGSINAEYGTGLIPTTGNDLIVVIFTDADGMSQGQNNISPCNFPACSTILPSTNFSTFMNSIPGSASYVIGVEDTDNEGLLQEYLHGGGLYVPIDLADDPAAVAATISSTIVCSAPVVGIAKNLTDLTNNMDGTYTVEYLLTIENFSSFALNTLEIFDDIEAQFSGYMPTNFMAINGSINGNPTWDGTATSNVLATGQTIAETSTETISVKFDFTHNGFASTVDNIASVNGMSPTGMMLTDTSTDGLDPDPDGDNRPDEMVPTTIMLPEIAEIGIAKNLTDITDNLDGTYTIEFLLTVENFSLIPLSNMEIVDDIVTQFSSYNPANFVATTGSINASGTWDGTATSNILAAGQTIAAGQTETVSIKFDITHSGGGATINNTATVIATTPANNTVMDDSTDGLDPDPDGNEDPDEMVSTPVTLPEIAEIGIAKNLTSLTNNNNGTFSVEFLFTVENLSLIPLSNIEVFDDIVTQFASVSPLNFMAISETLNANTDWNGTSSSNIVVAGQMIAPGEQKTVSIKFDIVHNGLATMIDNSAIVEGTTPSNMTVTDVSTDGVDPDPDGNGIPDEEEPTSVSLPESGAIGLAKELTSLTGNPDNSYSIEFLLTVENFALFPMNDLEIFDDVLTPFAGYSPMNFSIVSGSLSGNSLWDGSVTSNILEAGQSIAPGATETISVKFDIIPSGIMTTIFNTATVKGTSPSDTVYCDNSYNGLDPDPDMNDDPEEEMPTPVVLPVFAMVSGTVWKDADADGLNNNNEVGLYWVMVELVDCNGSVIASGFTDEDGLYAFSNVPPGQYMVNFDTSLLPDGCDFTFPNIGSDDSIDSDVDSNGSTECFDINSGDDLDFDAGLFYSLGTIGDRVWEDINGNGIQEGGEPGLNGVVVELYNTSGNVVATTATTGNGNYFFEQLVPGLYYVKYNVPSGYFSTSSFAGSNQTLDSNVDGSFGINTSPLFELGPGEIDLDIDAGYYMNALIGETVFFDSNKNDIFDSNENGINGMPVELWQIVDGQEVKVDEQRTHHKPGTASDDGYFKFSVPPGNYFLVMDIPDLGLVPVVQDALGYTPLSQSNESTIDSDIDKSNTTETFQINSGQVICNIGAGYYPMGTIGNRTWADNNYDGMQNANEPSLAGVQVRAYNTAGLMLGSDVSDDSGSYVIDYLGKDYYYLEFTPPSGYVSTTPKVGVDNEDSDIDNSNGFMTTQTYEVNSGDVLENVDGGFILSVVPVVWMSFTGQARRDINVLNWETASEINASHFYIERSESSTLDFQDIGRVVASGNSSTINNYKFEDKDVLNNKVFFYRLRQVDFNGKYSHSDILSLRRELSNMVAIYPNPVVDQLNIQFNLKTDTKVSLGLYDIQGKLITNLIDNELKTGNVHKSFDVKSLNSGTYLVQGTIGTKAYSKKVIVY